MHVSCTESDDRLVVALDGQLNESSASTLPSKMRLLCENKAQKHIVLDLSNCTVEGALAYGALVAFRLSPKVLKKQVSIQNAIPTVYKGMLALRFEKLFKIDSREQH